MKATAIALITASWMLIIAGFGLHYGWSLHVTFADGAVCAGLLLLGSINYYLKQVITHLIELVKQAIILNATTPERIDAAKTGRYKLFPTQS